MIPKSGCRFSEKIMLKSEIPNQTYNYFALAPSYASVALPSRGAEIGLGIFMHAV
jgi:hypothetical protein